MWDFHESVKLLDLIKGVDTWGETTMKAEDVSFNDSSQWKKIEELCELEPHICVSILTQALVIESVHLCDLLTFMISSKKSQSVRVPNLQAHQERHSLN